MRRDVVSPIRIVVNQGAVNAERVALEDRAAPERCRYRPGSILPKPVDQVFDQLGVAAVSKDRVELLRCRLEQAESGIQGVANDLNVLRDGVLALKSIVGNRT